MVRSNQKKNLRYGSEIYLVKLKFFSCSGVAFCEFFVGTIINFPTREFDAYMVCRFSLALLSLNRVKTKVMCSHFGAEK